MTRPTWRKRLKPTKTRRRRGWVNRVSASGLGARPPPSTAAPAVRRAARLDGRRAFRGRRRHVQPAARSSVHAAGHLLRVAAAAVARGAGRRGRVHPSRAGRHPCSLGAVPRVAPPRWVLGAAAGAGAAIAAVAVHAASSLLPDSWRRRASSLRFAAYLIAGGVAAATLGPWLVLVLLGSGLIELLARFDESRRDRRRGVLGAAGLGVRRGRDGVACWPFAGSHSRSARCPTAAGSSSSR